MLIKKIVLSISISFLLCCCATVRAPYGSVPKRLGIRTDAFGGWITLNLISNAKTVEGELVAVSSDSVFVFEGDTLQTFPTLDITYARVVLYNNNSSGYAGWTAIGSLATVLNGYYAVFTFPLFLITGMATTIAESNRVNYFDFPSNEWEVLKKYARFPQGIPEGINTSDLRPRSK
jgi:hypothetical protein